MKSQKLHVLHLPSWYLPEGGQFCRNQVQALNETGKVYASILANVSISIRKYGLKAFGFSKKFILSREDGIDVFRNYHISFPFFKIRDAGNWSSETLKMFEAYCLQFGKPDLLHVHSVLWAGYAASLIKEKHNIPYIITEHRGIFGLSCDWAKNQFIEWQDEYMQQAFSNSDLIITVSEKLIPKISSYLDRPVSMRVISNMVDTAFFYPKYKEKSKETIQAVMVNGFTYVKGYDILFPALDIAFERVDNLRITIVGEDFHGEVFDKQWSQVRHKDRITLAGEKDKFGVRDALWTADFFIISSRVESQSVSTLEALATGLPVVCTEVVPETIVNESNGLRVPVENVEKLSEAIISMSESYDSYDRLKLSDEIKKVADKKVVSGMLIDAYQSIINSK